MEYTALLEILNQYGLFVVFGLLFAEYLNLPGFPATPILMAIGVWARYEHILIPAFIVSVIGAQIGTMVLYGIGRGFGHLIMDRYYRRFPKHEQKVNHYINKIDEQGPHLLTVIRLIPVVRTLITIPAGMLRIDVRQFFIYSLVGIIIWNGVFLFAGGTVFEVVKTVAQYM